MRFSILNLARRAIHAARKPKLLTESVEFLWEGDAIETEFGEARWIQIATAGLYRGHASGTFQLDDAAFAEIVRNFRNHPAFKLGPAGVGVAPVVAFDWRHASEKDPNDGGALAIVSQAAQGWATDLQVRTMQVSTKDAAGRAVTETRSTLWALAAFAEPAKSLIQQGKIRWTSVAIWPDTPDTVTGQNIGWYLSSVALTNDPFIQGMYPVAAERAQRTEGGALVALGHWIDPYDQPKTPSEVIEKLRRIFGLAEMADLGEVLRQIATLKAAALGQMAAPIGVDVSELVAALRCLFNLPTLADPATVFAEADKLVAALAQEQAAQVAAAAQTAANAQTAEQIAAARAAQDKKEKNMEELIQLLATAFRVQPTKEAVLAAAKRLRLDRVDLRRFFALVASDDPKEMEDDEGGSNDAEKAMAKIKALLAAAGVENVDDATKQLVKQCADTQKLMETVPELMAALSLEADEEDKVAMEDVGEVMASRGYQIDQSGKFILDADGRDHANILLSRRTAGLKQFTTMPAKGAKVEEIAAWVTDTKAKLADRRAARTAFVAEYLTVQPQSGPADHYLFTRIAAHQGGQNGGGAAMALARMQQAGAAAPQFRGMGNGFAAGPAFPDPLQLGAGRGHGGQGGGNGAPPEGLPDLAAFSGNRTQRLLAAAQSRAGEQWKSLSQPQRFDKKRELEQQYIAAGFDLSQFDQVAPEGSLRA